MPITYASFDDAKSLSGIRLQVIKGIPSPWSEAVKAIFYVKKIPYTAILHDPFNQAQNVWFETNSAPSLKQGEEAALIDWLEILAFTEKASANPSLLPENETDQEDHLALCHALCSKFGLGWQRRLQSVDQGLNNENGFPIKIAHYLAGKYGYQAEDAALYESEVIRILGLLTTRLKHNALSLIEQTKGAEDSKGNEETSYYFAEKLTALDIYSAMFMAYFSPLPETVCPMHPRMRLAFESCSPAVAAALDPILLQHRDFIYKKYLELPLSL